MLTIDFKATRGTHLNQVSKFKFMGIGMSSEGLLIFQEVSKSYN